MKQFYFLAFVFLFSISCLNAQTITMNDSGPCISNQTLSLAGTHNGKNYYNNTGTGISIYWSSVNNRWENDGASSTPGTAAFVVWVSSVYTILNPPDLATGSWTDASGFCGGLLQLDGTGTDTAPVVASTDVAGSVNNSTVVDGESILITVTFSEDVTTTTAATATIPLTVGGVTRTASLQAGQTDITSSTLVFEYAVGSGENGAVVVLGADVITVTSGTIQDATGNDLTGDLGTVSGTVTVDTAPVVASTDVAGSVNNSVVVDGESILITVTFSEDVTTTAATATIPLTVGGVTRTASLQAGQTYITSSTLFFEYAVVSGENGAVIVFDTDVITVTSGIIQDATGNDLTGDLGTVSGPVTVDTAPVVVSTDVAGSVTDTVMFGESILITVTFSEDVTTTFATATIPLTVGGVTRTASLQAGQADITSSTLVFEYAVGSGENGAVIVFDTDVITVTSGTIQDATGNDLTGDLGTVSGPVTVDTAPVVVSTDVAGSVNNSVVVDGEFILITVTFSEDVTTTAATATIPLTVGGVTRIASLQAGQTDITSSILVFEYAVVSGENGAVIVFDTDVITVTSGTIQDATGNDLTGDLGTVSGTVTVDTAPVVVSTDVAGSVTDTVMFGESILITVTFSEDVTTTAATATIPLTIGGEARTVALQSEPVTSTESTLVFEYVVMPSDNGAVVVADTDTITVTAGTIQDAVGNNLTGDLGTVSGTVTVDNSTLSIADLDTLNEIKVYPNPTVGTVNINIKDIQNVIIYNVNGQKMFETLNNTFNISELESGMYFVHIKTKNGSKTVRLLRK
ncbi:T9SS type A sorting domain-containing protein [uncultured Lacinutrix sp.]|uniref:T9SS type A sorting domain-containing protein n=1 Tax=uncultured Lacinutrix sp. TaxID=574032 RepID=UPI0026270FAC|nr:T9SS type A sorting domain-containing protein [uncultured Lacinutrix sp.]